MMGAETLIDLKTVDKSNNPGFAKFIEFCAEARVKRHLA